MTYGPLPQVTTSDIQSEESERALANVLCKPLFILRKETPDCGVDFIAEAINDNRTATNYRLQIQLKSKDSARLVDDGSAMVVIFKKPSQLHYLFLGKDRSIVVAYDSRGQVLYWEWCDQIIERLDATRPNWRAQKSIRVRISTKNVLTRASADALRRELIAFCRRTARFFPREEGVPGDAPTAHLQGESLDELLSILRDGGLVLVSEGHAHEIVAVIREVPEATWAEDPKVVVVVAYAYHQVGSPLQSLHYANRLTEEAKFDEETQALLARIRVDARVSLGQMSLEAYWKELGAISKRFPESFATAQSLLEVMTRDVVFVEPRALPEVSAAILPILRRARALVEPYLARGKDKQRSIWALQLLLARVELEATDRLTMALRLELGMCAKLGKPWPTEKQAAAVRAALEPALAALARLETIETQAESAGDAEWMAQARLTHFDVLIKPYGLARINLGTNAPLPAELKTALEQVASEAGRLSALFLAADSRVLAFRAKKTQGNAYVTLEQPEPAAEVLKELQSLAQRFGFSAESAMLVDSLPQRDERDAVQRDMLLSEDMMGMLEEEVMRRHALPEERRAVVHQEFLAGRVAQRERWEWCRHLLMLEDLKHLRSPDTCYTKLPERGAKCELFGYESTLRYPEVSAVVTAFKAAHCNACSRRAPFANG